jgi:hypothetical protein
MYRAVTDKNPPDAVSRIHGDTLGSGLAAARAKYSPPFLQAIEWAVRLDEKQRPQSVALWKEQVLAERRVAPVVKREPDVERRAEARTILAATAKRPRRWPYVVGVVILALLATDFWRKNRANKLEAERLEQQRVMEAQRREEREQQMRQLVAAQKAEAARQALTAQKARDLAAAKQAAAVAAPAPTVEPPARPAVATAKPEPAASAPGDRFAEKALQEFKAADTNRDGYISLEEARGKFPALAQHFTRVDTDGDGRIPPREFLQAKRAVMEKRFWAK